MAKTGNQHLNFDIYQEDDDKVAYYNENGNWTNGEDFCLDLLEILKNKGSNYLESISSGSVTIMEKMIEDIFKDEREHLDKKDYKKFAKSINGFIKYINENFLEKGINMNDFGVMGIVIDARSGGVGSVGGSIGMFGDSTGHFMIVGSISGGVATTDINIMPSIMYYPNMKSVDELEGWGFSMDISIGCFDLDLIIGENTCLGIDLLDLFISSRLPTAEVLKKFNPKNMKGGITVGHSWNLLDYKYDFK